MADERVLRDVVLARGALDQVDGEILRLLILQPTIFDLPAEHVGDAKRLQELFVRVLAAVARLCCGR